MIIMKYAVIKNGGHQYKVSEGQILEVEKLDSDGKSYIFEEVLLTVDGDKVAIGTPFVADMKVYAEVIGDIKGDKIEVFKYKSKSRYRKHTGHRQKYTQVKITGIGTKGTAKPSVAKPVTSKPKGRSVKKVAAK
jgi:large subunit ribosomal protein L21